MVTDPIRRCSSDGESRKMTGVSLSMSSQSRKGWITFPFLFAFYFSFLDSKKSQNKFINLEIVL